MGNGGQRIGEALFIQLGLKKDGWRDLTVAFIQAILDDPSILDRSYADFVNRFFYYYEWYHHQR